MTSNAIWLEGWEVHEIKQTPDGTIAEASYLPQPAHCLKCGVVDRLYRHGSKVVPYRDTPAFGSKMLIRAKVGRFRCRDCGATSMQPLPDMDARRQMTKRCVAFIEEQGIAQTYASVARAVGVDEKTVRNICESHLDKVTGPRNLSAPLILGIDELTLGGRKRTIFVDIGGRKLLDIIYAMNRSRVDQWLYRLPDKHRVRLVTIDMWGPYKAAVNGILPNATIVVDKWHVVSKANDYLDNVRARYRRGAKGKDKRNPHKGRLLMHTRGSKLSPMRRMALDAMLSARPLLQDGWQCKEDFYSIWDAEDRATAEAAFDAWKQSIPDSVRPEFEKLAKTVENWRTEIFAFFDHPFTNAYTEARNRLIKDLSRAGRGYSFDRIRAKAILMQPITSKPLVLCEGCLGVFPDQKILHVHHIVPVSGMRGQIPFSMKRNMAMLCPNCHRRFHIERALSKEEHSTR